MSFAAQINHATIMRSVIGKLTRSIFTGSPVGVAIAPKSMTDIKMPRHQDLMVWAKSNPAKFNIMNTKGIRYPMAKTAVIRKKKSK
jgi:hypothetical protein